MREVPSMKRRAGARARNSSTSERVRYAAALRGILFRRDSSARRKRRASECRAICTCVVGLMRGEVSATLQNFEGRVIQTAPKSYSLKQYVSKVSSPLRGQ